MRLSDQSIRVARHLLFSVLITVGFILCYYDVLQWMYGRYVNPDSYYSHGFLIPFVSGFLIWQRRETLKNQQATSSLLGLFLIIAALLIHLFGVVLYVFSISGFSILILIFGISLFLLGRSVTRILLFPLLFLVFMFPLPQAIIDTVSYPLKLLVARLGADVVALLGIPVFREGFLISIPSGQLLVGNPCSGLRSLISFLAIGSLLAHMAKTSAFKKLLLSIWTVPIALFSNVVRVSILILVSHHWGLAAAAPETLLHTASGVLTFVLGSSVLFYSGALLDWET